MTDKKQEPSKTVYVKDAKTGTPYKVDRKDLQGVLDSGHVVLASKEEAAEIAGRRYDRSQFAPGQAAYVGVQKALLGPIAGAGLSAYEPVRQQTEAMLENHPFAAGAGEVAGTVMPFGLGKARLATFPGLMQGAGKVAAAPIAAGIGKGAISKGVGFGLEGAAHGASAYLNDALIRNKKVSSDEFLASMGPAGLIGMAFGGTAGLLGKMGKKAGKASSALKPALTPEEQIAAVRKAIKVGLSDDASASEMLRKIGEEVGDSSVRIRDRISSALSGNDQDIIHLVNKSPTLRKVFLPDAAEKATARMTSGVVDVAERLNHEDSMRFMRLLDGKRQEQVARLVEGSPKAAIGRMLNELTDAEAALLHIAQDHTLHSALRARASNLARRIASRFDDAAAKTAPHALTGSYSRNVSREMFKTIDDARFMIQEQVNAGRFAGTKLTYRAREVYENLRQSLMDETIWGKAAAAAQRETQDAFSRAIGTQKTFGQRFLTNTGHLDEFNPWVAERAVSHAKVQSMVENLHKPGVTEDSMQVITNYAMARRDLSKAMAKHFDLDASTVTKLKKAIEDSEDLVKRLNVYTDEAKVTHAAMKLLGSTKGVWLGMTGAVLGGPTTFLAGQYAMSLANPGKAAQFLAGIERVKGPLKGRMNGALSRFMKGKGRSVKKGFPRASMMLTAEGTTDKESFHKQVERLATMQSNPDLIAGNVAKELGDSGIADGGEVAQKLIGIISDLVSSAPRHTLSTLFGDVDVGPSDIELDEWNRKFDVLMDPASMSELLASGELTGAEVDAVERHFPEIVSQIQAEIVRLAAEGSVPGTYDDKVQLSILFKAPADVSMTPEYIAAQQQAHEQRYGQAEEQSKQLSQNRRTFGETGAHSSAVGTTASSLEKGFEE